jgi:hypothetical protein
MKVLESDGLMSWTAFHCQVKGIADHKGWPVHEKGRQFFWRSCYILYSAPMGAAYEDIIRVSKSPCTVYQLSGEPLQKFAAAIEQLAHQAILRSPENLIH